jgi:peptidoglycan/LPS O-acetylase OafA/YrhL
MSIDGPGSPPHRFEALDALRGVAAFAVLFYHLRTLEGADGAHASLPAFASGYLAVDLFFLLSGFVISHAYDQRLHDGLSLRRFMIARFVRLQPTIAIATLLGFAVALSQRLSGAADAAGLFAIATSFAANLLMLPNVLVPWGIFLLNPPAWSLFYELVANAVYAAGIRKTRVRLKGAKASSTVDRWLLLACLGGLAGLSASLALGGSLDRGVVLADAPVALSRITFSFALGALLSRHRQRWLPRLPHLPVPLLLLACLCPLAAEFDGTPRATYDLAFAAVLSPALVMLTAAARPSGRLAAASSWLGMISYPLYAVHAPVKHMLEAALPLSFVPMLTIIAIAAVTCAWMTAIWAEPPLRRWLAGKLQGRGDKAAPPLIAQPQLQGEA